MYWGYAAFGEPGFSLALAFLHFLSDVIICISITHFYRVLAKKYQWHTLGFRKLLFRIVPSVFILGFVYMMVSIAKLWLVHHNFRDDFLQSFSDYYHENSTPIFMAGVRLMSIWLLAYYLYHYAQREFKTIQENARLSIIAKEAQLNNLSAQLNPHFFFNSLNSIKSLVSESPESSRRAIDLLSDLLRKSLYERGPMLISVREELAVVHDYLELEKIRFEERLQFEISVPENILSCLIIPFSIHTLVENAVKHGINRQSDGGSINIKIDREDEYICMSVESPGCLDRETINNGIGLKNLQERLKLQFNHRAKFNIAQQENEKVLATIMIPAA